MKDFYITFGQVHVHSINGKTFDKDCLCEIKAESMSEAHQIAMSIFEGRFHRVMEEGQLMNSLPYFPRGIIKLRGTR